MTTLLLTHADCLGHDPGPMHPERPARLEAVWAALDDDSFDPLIRRTAPKATVEQLSRVHPRGYVDAVLEAIPEQGIRRIDADTAISPGSGDAALRAAGAACAAVDAVMAGEVDNAFCAVRPPGHHAEPTIPMGFCLFNSVAVAAEQARVVHGLKRVAVVDFDVHHGNGTQAMFQNDAGLFYGSTHQSPLFPGTGARAERGVGNIVNVPLPPMAGSAEFRRAMTELILPAAAAFEPELLIVSAGFDGHEDDPLASLRFTDEDFVWITVELMRLATRYCGGRLVSSLEGGYDLDALGRCAAAHVWTLMGEGVT